MNQLVPYAALGPGLSKADETHIARGIHELVGADRRISDHAVPRSNPAGPNISVAGLGTQRPRLRGLAQLQQEHRCGFERIVEYIVGERREAGSLERLAPL